MPFDLNVVTPHGQAFAGPADSIVLPGAEGEFQVLPHHERFLTALRPGEVVVRRGSETVRATISDGFAEVRSESVTVLVESWQPVR
ncbi:MAG TPA: ATP synthase F1 subunit epsilon [Myxococcota bacterium]|nr:ATP synthase F1 subunit epsilon [Myxococcota bacterium]